MLRKIIFLFFILAAPVAVAESEPNQAIHEELRALLQNIQKAVNEERYADLMPLFHKNMRVTTINQEVISSPEEIPEYFNRWFGPNGYLKKVEMKLTADALTELYNNNTFGIVRGSGDENYILSDKRKFDMKTRWTATVIKDTDGKWRILSLHIGTNFLDNPILDQAESALLSFSVAGFIAGIILMLLISFIRRKVKG